MTPLLHGAEISAADIEAEIARWTAERFARLCNALAWARIGVPDRRQAFPVFTERVNVADNGIDAEWEGDLTQQDVTALEPFLRPGFNVFQYKMRGTGPGNRAKEVAKLKREVGGAANAVSSRTGYELASYKLWTNIHLTVDQNKRLRTAILEGMSDEAARRCHAMVVGAAELAAMLNDLPHLRSAFFVTSAFRDWGRAFEAHERQALPIKTTGLPAPMIGRERSIDHLRVAIDERAVRAIVVAGPHMIGKSRLTLEAVRHRDVDVVEALDSSAVTAGSLHRLAKSDRETIVLLQDVSPEAAELAIRDALAMAETIKVILTVATRDGAPLPNFGLDARTRVMQVPPLDEAASRQLFKHHLGECRVDYGTESWIIEQAGGVPGILLAAALFGRDLRPSAGSFTDQIGAALEYRLRKAVPEPSLQNVFGIAALLAQVRVEGDDDAELAALSRPFGAEPYVVRAAIEPLENAGYLSRSGSFIALTPPILASRLAARVAQSRPADVIATFQSLPHSGRRRLLRRLVQLPEEHTRRFWSWLFDPEGPLGTFEAVRGNPEIFRAAAAAAFPRSAAIVHEGLKGLSLEERRALEEDGRRALVSSMQELLTSATTAGAAFSALALLAEAETEDYGNNATGIFCHGAYPLNGQMPLPLSHRLPVLQEMLSPLRDPAAALVALQAAGEALSHGRSIIMVPSRGARPAGGLPLGMSWEDVRAYCARLLDLIGAAVDDPRAAVRQKAKLVWPGAAEQFVYDVDGNASRGISAFESIVDRILRGDPELPVAQTVNTIALCRKNMYGVLAARSGAAGASLAAALTGLLTKLKTGSFEVRLRWRLGNSWHDLDDDDVGAAEPHDPFHAKTHAISELAREACDVPEILSRDLIAWCISEEANAAGLFWRALGQHDVAGRWIARIVDLARAADGWWAAVNFVAGAWAHDQSAGRLVFARMEESLGVQPLAIAYTSTTVEGAERAAARLTDFLHRKIVTPQRAAGFAGHPPFQDRVSSVAFAALLEAIIGEAVEHPELVIHALAFWFHYHPAVDPADPVVMVAWRCVEAPVPTGRVHDGYDASEVAAGLVRLDPNRGFRLVDAAASRLIAGMRNPGSDTHGVWSPFDQAGSHQPCWEALREIDRDRALTIVFDHVTSAGRDGFILAMQLKNVIRLPSDVEFLRTYAAQGEAQAETVAEAIAGRDPGFWDIACEIYERHPDNDKLKGKLGWAIGGFAGGFIGGLASQADDAIAEIENARSRLDDRFPRTRLWLDEMLAAYRKSAAEARLHEEDWDIDR